ncbi:MAG: hypothetical protein E3J94_03665 [Desulfobacteraceae bacterium]|nr:MAG: hypothetical protein E3J94_03665 [Desulfobacteraceae bacterium]
MLLVEVKMSTFYEDQNANIVAHEYNFTPPDDIRCEHYEITEQERVILLASRHNSMNILVRYNHNELDRPE